METNLTRKLISDKGLIDTEGIPRGISIDGLGRLNVNTGEVTADAPIISTNFNQIQGSTTVAVAPTMGSHQVTVDDDAGISAGDYLVLFSLGDARVSTFLVVGTPVANVVTVDSPIDFSYPIGASVEFGTIDMDVNGSAGSPQVFGIRGSTTPQPVDITIEITRIITLCLCGSTPELDEFGDIAGGLTNGLVLRHRTNGSYENKLNVKTNGDLANQQYDFREIEGGGFFGGQPGFYARMTFTKMGSAIRLEPGEDLELVISDPLASLDVYRVIAQGKIVA